MPLEFRIRRPLSLPVDAAMLTLDRLRELSVSEVEQIPLATGNRTTTCGELFEVSGSAQDDCVTWFGDCRRIQSIGAKLSGGTVRVEGDAGIWLGAGMIAGSIHVTGSAGDMAGMEIRGGCIEIRGDAGHHVGGAQAGSKRGMAGGEIRIHGNAGDHAGVRMRRGLIAIGGSIGAGAGAGMIAGTILIGGDAGPEVGRGMKRGTILFLKTGRPAPSPTGFQLANTAAFTFVQLYLRHLNRTGFPLPSIPSDAPFRLYRGDSLELGLGEILCLQGASMR